MNKSFLKLGLILLLFGNSVSYIQSQIDFQQSSFEDLVEKSLQENKPIFLFLSNNNNDSWWMENNVFNNQAIGELYNENFVCGVFYGQINYSDLTTEKLKIKEYPFILYFDPATGAAYSATGGKNKEQIYSYGKTVINEFNLYDIIKRQVNNFADGAEPKSYKILDNDGRFTLGVQGRRLMYGYPYPNSTSHFVINANGDMASNSPRFLINRDLEMTDYLQHQGFFARFFKFFKRKKDKIKLKAYNNVHYLSDTLAIRFDKSNSMHSEISFRYNGLKITQKLSPLNKNLEASRLGDSTRYYQVDYILKNDSDATIKSGLLVLFDMMIDDNDAAKMDVFNTDIIEHVSKEQKRESIKLRGKYAKYSPVNGLQRILVYRNKKLTSDLTGDFRIVTQPDEIHIGSWPLFYSVLWDVPAVKKNQKYYDSAVILKWNPYPILPGEEQYYTTIFGIYNKGILDLVPAGTNYAGVDKKGRRITLSPPEFTVSPDTIYEGQTASLSWKLENPLNAEVYVSAKPKTKQRDKGRISVKPKTSTAYYLQMLDNGKQIANVKAKLVVLKRPKNHEFDGRFTIGSGKKAISFGYPFPYSTSYFQLYSNKKYYSNNRGLLKAEYLPGKQEEFVADDKKNILSYETKEFNIEQTLIPLDEEYKKTEKRNAKFFRVQYIVKNKGKYKATYSFKQFLDLSSFVSDSLNLKINGHPSRFNISYTGKDIPKTVLFSDNSALSDIKLLTVASGSEKPRSVSIADWHFLQDLKVSRKYSDSIFYKNPAVLIWWKKTVLAGEKLKFAFILGSKQVDSIAYLYNKAEELKTLTVNFETNSNKISKKSTTKIVDYIKKNKFDFIVLNGFADSRGTLENNYKLAEKRINSIKELILKKGSVDSSKILKKVHGEFFSNQKTNKEEIDDANERKVNIVLYRIK